MDKKTKKMTPQRNKKVLKKAKDPSSSKEKDPQNLKSYKKGVIIMAPKKSWSSSRNGRDSVGKTWVKKFGGENVMQVILSFVREALSNIGENVVLAKTTQFFHL